MKFMFFALNHNANMESNLNFQLKKKLILTINYL